MDYFNKVKNASLKVAAQGMSLIQNVGQDMGLSVTASADKRPSDDFVQRFQSKHFALYLPASTLAVMCHACVMCLTPPPFLQ